MNFLATVIVFCEQHLTAFENINLKTIYQNIIGCMLSVMGNSVFLFFFLLCSLLQLLLLLLLLLQLATCWYFSDNVPIVSHVLLLLLWVFNIKYCITKCNANEIFAAPFWGKLSRRKKLNMNGLIHKKWNFSCYHRFKIAPLTMWQSGRHSTKEIPLLLVICIQKMRWKLYFFSEYWKTVVHYCWL